MFRPQAFNTALMNTTPLPIPTQPTRIGRPQLAVSHRNHLMGWRYPAIVPQRPQVLAVTLLPMIPFCSRRTPQFTMTKEGFFRGLSSAPSLSVLSQHTDSLGYSLHRQTQWASSEWITMADNSPSASQMAALRRLRSTPPPEGVIACSGE